MMRRWQRHPSAIMSSRSRIEPASHHHLLRSLSTLKNKVEVYELYQRPCLSIVVPTDNFTRVYPENRFGLRNIFGS